MTTDPRVLQAVVNGWRNGKPLYAIMAVTGLQTPAECMNVVRYLQLPERSPTTCEIFLPEEPIT